ncbi:MAG: hypothetical protein OEU36_25505, partial [Gammaproteobacteria bacterium]|nr:hypothetical protein [Gammaproteobacteria bacterium]
MDKYMRTGIEEQLKIARNYIASGKIPAAINIANDFVKKNRTSPKGWLLLSEINVAGGNIINALENAKKSVQLDASWPPSLAQLARCYMLSGQKRQAGDTARRAASYDPEDAESLDALAAVLTYCDEQQLALTLSEKAVRQQPGNPWYRYNLATIQRMLGMLGEAEANCDKAIKYNPDDFRAYHVRSDLRTQTRENNHIDQLENRLAAGVRQWRGEMMLNFALAKEKEDMEDYEGSFQNLKKACELQRSHLKYRVADDIETIAKIVSTCTVDAFANAQR